ncbi:E3 ubiquitin-protein ligase RNF10-like [Saccoglossus kowalevskii]|uniref:E3 ubiquitin-protein ligase RNF10 n=1 Tax=Saccoglossus kowalevskii TaxID=10224 RepID=A0ABM0GSW0_SACKO|nr:PREDICTED: RING finger protein 10-like [Saccoglossus kowalevskii]
MLEATGEMEKKYVPRSASATPTNKGSNGDSNKNKDRGNNGGSKFSRRKESPVPRSEPSSARRPTPQKTKALDKRPRSRNVYGGRREEVTETQRAEFGSALSYGPKKMNLNHLLNFTYSPRETTTNSGSWKVRNKWGTKRVRYNKEQFLQANCQFIVKSSGDYTVHAADPDILVNWELIEQVRIFSHMVPSCPICLYPPTAAKITRCGHIYCWPCILHYLSLSDKTWKKCPICYEAVHQNDLKSVVAMATHQYAVGEEITMKLMKREKGSIIALPKNEWIEAEAQPFSLGQTIVNDGFVKLLVADPKQVQEQIIVFEKTALECKLADKDEESEQCFIESALSLLQEREKMLIGDQNIVNVAGIKLCDNAEEPVDDEIIMKHWTKNQDAIVYVSAFDEVVDETAMQPPKPPVSHDEPPVSHDEPPVSHDMPPVSHDVPQLNDNSIGRDDKCVDESVQVKSCASADTGHVYYFYQAEDGQHLYLHPVNVRCLMREYGSLANCPDTISATILETTGYSMTEDYRKRFRYICHLPLTCEFTVCELALKPPIVSRKTLDEFLGEFQRRKKVRDRKARDEKKHERRIHYEEEKKKGKFPNANLTLESNRQFPVCGVDVMTGAMLTNSDVSQPSSPDAVSVISTSSDSSQFVCGSPQPDSSLNPHAAEFTPGSPPPVVGSIDSLDSASSIGSPSDGQLPRLPSFADMLRAGKSKDAIPRRASVPARLDHTVSVTKGHGDSEDSDAEEPIAVPLYKDAFSDAIQNAIDKATVDKKEMGASSDAKKSKKGKKKQLLFSTSIRYK